MNRDAFIRSCNRRATKVLFSGMAIWDDYCNNPHLPFRREALKQKTLALVNHDRIKLAYDVGVRPC